MLTVQGEAGAETTRRNKGHSRSLEPLIGQSAHAARVHQGHSGLGSGLPAGLGSSLSLRLMGPAGCTSLGLSPSTEPRVCENTLSVTPWPFQT